MVYTVCMPKTPVVKKTFNVNVALLAHARRATGAQTDTQAIRLGLEALVRHEAYQQLAALGGSEPRAKQVPRRREPTRRKRRAA
jgi:hypothetical protein